jgi:hypothetical protein
MSRRQFQDQFRFWLREQLGEDLFTDGAPNTPPDWLRQSIPDPAILERTWAVFRNRFNEAAQDVTVAIIRARQQTPGEPSDQPRTMVVPPSTRSALERDEGAAAHA